MTDKKLLLAIETSGSVCGVCLGDDSGVIAEYSLYGKNLHDKMLSELIRRITNDFNYKIDDLGAVAVSAGPGSFTGLRIGASVAKALCYGDDPKLIAVPTLSALAISASETAEAMKVKSIIPVIPAYKNIIYYQEFDPEGKEISAIESVEYDDFPDNKIENTLFCGPGSNMVKGGLNIGIHNELNSRMIFRLGYEYFRDSKFTKADDFIPMYVQEFQPKTGRKNLKI